MQSSIIRSSERGQADYGWLKARYYFSFANYYNPAQVHFGALRVINDDSIGGGHGFDTHPHDNMEIITIPQEGALAHKDSMGHEQVIWPGEVQVMSAGTGIRHSEYNHLADADTKLFQIWIFPREKNVKPRYDQKKFEAADRKDRWQKLVGPDETDGALMIHQDAWIWQGDFSAGTTISYQSTRKENGIYLVVINGKAETSLGALDTRDALAWYNGKLEIKSATATSLLLIDVPLSW